MTVGQAAATVNAIIDAELRGVAYAGNSTPYLQLHTGDPGASGTASVSSVTTRKALTFSAASGGATSAAEVTWTSWAGTSPETVTHVSIWSASSAGTFIRSGLLTTAKTVTTGDTLGVTVSASQSPIAA